MPPAGFEVETQLGLTVRCSAQYWKLISTEKHPVLRERQSEVIEALQAPDEIRRSRKDEAILLFYRGGPSRWTCAVVKRENGTGFLVTAYPTDVIKAGELIWTRSR